jgi:hypothetical protein
MPLPELSDAQVTWVAGEVAKYIEQQRNRYAKTAAPLSATQKALLRPFFGDAVLDSARLVILQNSQADSQVENPPFYSQSFCVAPLSFNSCHPERSKQFAKRSASAVEGPHASRKLQRRCKAFSPLSTVLLFTAAAAGSSLSAP